MELYATNIRYLFHNSTKVSFGFMAIMPLEKDFVTVSDNLQQFEKVEGKLWSNRRIYYKASINRLEEMKLQAHGCKWPNKTRFFNRWCSQSFATWLYFQCSNASASEPAFRTNPIGMLLQAAACQVKLRPGPKTLSFHHVQIPIEGYGRCCVTGRYNFCRKNGFDHGLFVPNFSRFQRFSETFS